MYVANVNFNELPEIGFAHQHFSSDYKATYGKNRRMCIEIAYINSGTLKLELYGEEMLATVGCVLVLFRRLPITTENVGKKPQNHCTVLAEFTDYEFSLAEENKECGSGFLIPFITEPCRECEEIGKRLHKIAALKAKNKEENNLALSVEFLSILMEIHRINETEETKSGAYEAIYQRVCEYVEENQNGEITLLKIARSLGKSPNHISHAFKSVKGITVKEYINSQKVKRIKNLMKMHNISFKDAVYQVGLCDVSYGYRVFKKYAGVTPKEYMSITTIKKSD